jgi:hypothetical protein
MVFWQMIFIVAFLTGIMGWTVTPFFQGLYWFLEWKDGNHIDWGLDAALMMLVPGATIFATVEIFALFFFQ